MFFSFNEEDFYFCGVVYKAVIARIIENADHRWGVYSDYASKILLDQMYESNFANPEESAVMICVQKLGKDFVCRKKAIQDLLGYNEYQKVEQSTSDQRM